jgi:hypothetical protein
VDCCYFLALVAGQGAFVFLVELVKPFVFRLLQAFRILAWE